MQLKDKHKIRHRKHMSVRRRVSGNSERPRLCVFRSLQHIYAQLIDDERGHTVCQASTTDKEIRTRIARSKSLDAAKLVGETIAKRAREQGVEKVVFDRNWYKYHGRIKALADAAREGGLKF